MKYFVLSAAALLGLFFASFSEAQSDYNFKTDYRKSCNFISNVDYNDDWCNPGNKPSASPDLILIGDSYSNALTTFLDPLSQRTGFVYQQYGRGQCPMLLNYGPDFCRSFAQTAFDRIKSQPHIKTVVLAAYWPSYYSGKYFDWLNVQVPADDFKNSFQFTIDAYRSIGKTLIVIYSPPILGYDPHSCLPRPGSTTATNPCVREKSEVLAAQTPYRLFFKPILQHSKIPTFDPVKYFCNDSTCFFNDNGKLYTTDGWVHLSVYGGDFLSQNGGSDFIKLFKIKR